MSTQDCDRGEPQIAVEAWDWIETVNRDGLSRLTDDGWEPYAVTTDGNGDLRHHLRRRVPR